MAFMDSSCADTYTGPETLEEVISNAVMILIISCTDITTSGTKIHSHCLVAVYNYIIPKDNISRHGKCGTGGHVGQGDRFLVPPQAVGQGDRYIVPAMKQ